MGIDISALSQAALTATSLSNLILVTPGVNQGIRPQFPQGTSQFIQAFLFDIEGENSITLESDITDHYAEDNEALNDQISNKPILVNTHGYVGELTDILPVPLQPLKQIADKLTIIDALTPALSVTALEALNVAAAAYATAQMIASSAVSAWGTIAGSGSSPVQNKQQLAYQMFLGYRAKKTLFTVQTPWAIHQNMAIKSLRAIQEEETSMISQFEVTFKQMRFARTINSPSALQMAGRASDAASGIQDQGISRPIPGLSLGAQLNKSGLSA